MLDPTPTRLALFGKPIKTSLSPVIHGRFADQLGLKISYELIETGPEGFPQALEDFRLIHLPTRFLH